MSPQRNRDDPIHALKGEERQIEAIIQQRDNCILPAFLKGQEPDSGGGGTSRSEREDGGAETHV